MSAQLSALLNHPAIWRGGELARVADGIPTGFPELDALLPGGGWPNGALTELLIERQGIGELSLLTPALAKVSQAGRTLAFVAPPYLPYAPALARGGIALDELFLIDIKFPKDKIWVMEQALRSGVCGAVLGWQFPDDDRTLRRLQLAAEEGKSWGVLFRAAESIHRASPAALRLFLTPGRGNDGAQDKLVLRVLKRRGGGKVNAVVNVRNVCKSGF
ncbi:MAG TPA: translesion DNA synthesis-associated protein ImuA [Burkholderiales bacterium]|nr:translesion DNA synthesis-associated protein ImuA [Burkholderiales bacterium]